VKLKLRADVRKGLTKRLDVVHTCTVSGLTLRLRPPDGAGLAWAQRRKAAEIATATPKADGSGPSIAETLRQAAVHAVAMVVAVGSTADALYPLVEAFTASGEGEATLGTPSAAEGPSSTPGAATADSPEGGAADAARDALFEYFLSEEFPTADLLGLVPRVRDLTAEYERLLTRLEVSPFTKPR
jgi:hypothetical protein